MKKASYLVAFTATVASLATISAAYALHVSTPNDVEIGINVRTNDDIQFTLTDLTTIQGELGVNKSYEISFKAGADKTASSNYTQPYVPGRLDVKVSSTSQELINALSAEYHVSYTDGSYFANTAELNSASSLGVAVVEDTGVYSLTIGSSVVTSIDNGNLVNYKLTLSDSSVAAIKALNKASFDIDISYSEDTTYNYAYVVNDEVGWVKSDKYRMVPNIESTSWEWMWLGSMEVGTEFKVWHDTKGYSTPDNSTVTGALNGIYWSGNVSDAPTADYAIA